MQERPSHVVSDAEHSDSSNDSFRTAGSDASRTSFRTAVSGQQTHAIESDHPGPGAPLTSAVGNRPTAGKSNRIIVDPGSLDAGERRTEGLDTAAERTSTRDTSCRLQPPPESAVSVSQPPRTVLQPRATVHVRASGTVEVLPSSERPPHMAATHSWTVPQLAVADHRSPPGPIRLPPRNPFITGQMVPSPSRPGLSPETQEVLDGLADGPMYLNSDESPTSSGPESDEARDVVMLRSQSTCTGFSNGEITDNCSIAQAVPSRATSANTDSNLRCAAELDGTEIRPPRLYPLSALAESLLYQSPVELPAETSQRSSQAAAVPEVSAADSCDHESPFDIERTCNPTLTNSARDLPVRIIRAHMERLSLHRTSVRVLLAKRAHLSSMDIGRNASTPPAEDMSLSANCADSAPRLPDVQVNDDSTPVQDEEAARESRVPLDI